MLPVEGLPSGLTFHLGLFYDKHDNTKINLSLIQATCQYQKSDGLEFVPIFTMSRQKS